MDLGEKLDETLEKMAPLSKSKVEDDGESSSKDAFEMNAGVGAVEGSPDREDGSVSQSEAVASSPGPGDVRMSEEGLAAGEFTGESPTEPIGSPTSAVGSAGTTKKGYGLKKKWRRIRRSLNKDETGGGDSGLILKRRLSLAEAPKAREDHKIKSDGEAEAEAGVEVEAEVSVASVDSNVLFPSLPMVPTELDPELEFLAAAGFAVGIDSENSEDRSSKSSTAASAPRPRHEAIGFGRERNRARGTGGRGSVYVGQQRGQRTRGIVDTNRRHSGHSKIEKENSYSSVESDLRSSGANFAQWGSVTSDGKKSEKSVSYYRDHSDEAQPSEEVQSSYHKENGHTGNSSKADLDGDLLEENIDIQNENIQSESNLDPFIASIASLKAVQEALENEIHKFVEVRKEATIDDTDGLYQETEGSDSPISAAHFTELNRRIEQLESKLEEALETVKIKELKILELETLVKKVELSNQEKDPLKMAALQDKCKKLEIYLESIFAEKMEAEVKYLIMTRTTQNWKVQAENHIALSGEQSILAQDIAEFKLKLREAEDKYIIMKVDIENSEDKYKEMQMGQEVLRFQNEVCEYSLCLLVQMFMLFVAFVLFFVQPVEFVPT